MLPLCLYAGYLKTRGLVWTPNKARPKKCLRPHVTDTTMVSKSVVGLHRPVLFKTEKLLCGSGRLCCGVPVTERFHWYDRVWPCGERYHWRYFNPNILLNPWQYKSAFTAYGTIIKKQKTRKNPNGVHFILGNASL